MTDTEPVAADPQPAVEHRRVGRIILLIVSLLLGVALIVVGDYLNYGALRFDPATGPYWSGVAVNAGTTVVLAAVLVWFERQLTRRVEAVRADAARDVGEAREDFQRALQEATSQIQVRMDELDARAAERAQSALQAEAAAVERLGEVPTRRAILDAVHTARDLNAIRDRGAESTITVPAGPGSEAPLVRVVYGITNNVFEGAIETLRLELVEGGFESVDWGEDDDALDTFEKLRTLLIRGDQGALAGFLSPEGFFGSLRSALDQALTRRQGVGDFWIEGSPVQEMFAPGWFVTNLGVEHEGDGLVVPAEAYGHWDRSQAVWGGPGAWFEQTLPDRPESVTDGALWLRAIERGRFYFEESSEPF